MIRPESRCEGIIMDLNIKIKMDNAAFGEDMPEKYAEAARILRELADNMAYGRGFIERLRDLNGNHVGDCWISTATE